MSAVGRVEVHLVDLETGVDDPAELVDRRTAGDEVLHHLRRDRGRIGRNAARGDAVVAGKDQGAGMVEPRRVPRLPGREPDRQLLEPAERAGRLGQLRLTQGRRGAGLEIGARQMGQQRADLVQIRNRLVHATLPSVFGSGAIVSEHRRGPKRKFRARHCRLGYCPVMTAPDDPVRRPVGLFAGFAVATAFFTRIPIAAPWCQTAQLADAAWAFPLVGAGVGAVAAFAFMLAQLLGLGDWPAALLAVLAGLGLTGALHEDGLADTADGLIGGDDREARLAIMRDSRHGTFGVLAVVLSVLLRAAALAGIGEAIHAGLALIAAHAASRAALPIAMRALAPARADGLGAAAGTPSAALAVAAFAIGALISVAALGPGRGAVALGFAGAAVFAACVLAHRRIGGYTGDVLGAFQQIGEIVVLLTAAAR